MDIPAPHVENKLIDKARGITYRVMAYRALTSTELRMAVAAYRASTRVAPQPRQTITILTTLGL